MASFISISLLIIIVTNFMTSVRSRHVWVPRCTEKMNHTNRCKMALIKSANDSLKKNFQIKSIINDQTNNESIRRIKRDLNGIKNSQEKYFGNILVKNSPIYEKTKTDNVPVKIVGVSEKKRKRHGNFLLKITKVKITVEKEQEENGEKVVVVEEEEKEEQEEDEDE